MEMKIKAKAMGDYMTNCFIVTINEKDLIIDAGLDAVDWVMKYSKNPVAILNTHGHFDHIWSNKELKEKLNIPIYIPKGDAFMLTNDPFHKNTPPSEADFKVEPDAEIEIEGIKVKFHHFPGHTPGSSAIEIGNTLFSGDFIFKDSIGRVDFPYSNPEDMKKSIHKFINNYNKKTMIYPGHGAGTDTNSAKRMLKPWLNFL